MNQPNEPHNQERVERGAMEIALLTVAAADTAVNAAKLVHDVIKDRPPKEEPPKVILPPGVDVDSSVRS